MKMVMTMTATIPPCCVVVLLSIFHNSHAFHPTALSLTTTAITTTLRSRVHKPHNTHKVNPNGPWHHHHPLQMTPHALFDMIPTHALSDAVLDSTASSSSTPSELFLLTALALAAPVFFAGGNSSDDNNQNDNEHDSTDSNNLSRRSTLTTLMTGAAGLAASDMLVGAAGNFMGSNGVVQTVYGAQYHPLFQRVAKLVSQHETALASPELLAHVAKSPAAWMNPELRAWIAAQRALRTAAMASAVVEEGMASVGLVAAAATASLAASKKNKSHDDNQALLSATTDDDELAMDSGDELSELSDESIADEHSGDKAVE